MFCVMISVDFCFLLRFIVQPSSFFVATIDSILLEFTATTDRGMELSCRCLNKSSDLSLLRLRVFYAIFSLDVRTLRLLSLVTAHSLIPMLFLLCLAHFSAHSRFERILRPSIL